MVEVFKAVRISKMVTWYNPSNIICKDEKNKHSSLFSAYRVYLIDYKRFLDIFSSKWIILFIMFWVHSESVNFWSTCFCFYYYSMTNCYVTVTKGTSMWLPLPLVKKTFWWNYDVLFPFDGFAIISICLFC